jgi:pSer/pThr/pTyr-binding forkhead associated (FHA) protein
MAILCQIREDGSIARQWELGRQPLVVGRGDGADAHIEDASASRRHSIIFREGEGYIIEDLGSQNGTWVDGRRVLAARLSHNSRILVGRTQLVILECQPSAVMPAQTSEKLPATDPPARPAMPALVAISQRPGLAKQP